MMHTLLIFFAILLSPDGQLSATFDGTHYALSKGDTTVIASSNLGLNMDNWSWEMALGFRDWKQYDNWMTPMVLDSTVEEAVPAVKDYNALRLYYSRHDASMYRFEVEVQLYNYGLAFRYFLPEHPKAVFHRVTDDLTTYSLPDNTTIYAQYWAQDCIHPISFNPVPELVEGQPSTLTHRPMELPLTFSMPCGIWGSILTADVDHWCHTRLQLTNTTLSSIFLSPVDVVTYAYTPWKLILVGNTPADLLTHGQTFVDNHAEPCDQTADFSWVKPGTIMRCNQLTMTAARRTIDFCAQHHIDYMLFDWKWYEPCTSHDGDATKPIPALDIPALCAYAKTKGIGIWLYVNQHALMKQADTLFPLLRQWGVVGVKSGFVEYTTQYWSEWLHDLVRLAADNHLMMNIHDEYRPSGFSHTYPNLLTQEGICGNEEFPDANHDVNLLFTRMLCGAADYTICYKDKRLKNTLDHQKALSLCICSPLVTLFWYDKAEQFSESDDLTWFENLPTTWDETRVLALVPDGYAAMARRHGDTWYIGVLNGNDERTVSIDLSPLNIKDKALITQCRQLHLEARGGAVFTASAATPSLDQTLNYCHRQIARSLTQLGSPAEGQPRNIPPYHSSWTVRANTPDEWCNGFWSGCLWYDGNYEAARAFSAPLQRLATTPIYDHDLGFQVITSLLNGYRLTGDTTYRRLLLMCADSLATLYNPQVGTILSWPRNVALYGGHNTIMDNMMNLELLFWAAEQSPEHSHLRQMAISHADTTMRYQFRDDGTNNHVAVYDPVTGKHLYNCTHQGLNDSSVWARGQAWAVYGYTMAYRYTHDRRYLDFAQKVTDWYLSHLPADYIPYWDFNVLPPFGEESEESLKDASASCITLSALLELAHYVPASKAKVYREAAQQIYRSLTLSYEAGEQSSALLLHSTGHRPAGSEMDYAIIYADYYFMEALYRMKYGINYIRH